MRTRGDYALTLSLPYNRELVIPTSPWPYWPVEHTAAGAWIAGERRRLLDMTGCLDAAMEAHHVAL